MSDVPVLKVIHEHRVFLDGTRLDALETAVANLTERINAMGQTLDTMNSEQDETDAKAQAALDLATATAEAYTDLKSAFEQLQQQAGEAVTAEQLAAWKARSDAGQAKIDEANAKLQAILNPPAPAA